MSNSLALREFTIPSRREIRSLLGFSKKSVKKSRNFRCNAQKPSILPQSCPTCWDITSILGRGNTSNISNYHLAFLAIALDVSKKYNLGALIARRLAARGPIYGGIVVAHIVAALGLSIAPHDILLTLQRLDLAAMKLHHFVTANSCAGKLVYRMLFTYGEEREVPLPQPSLFSIHSRPWSRSKEDLDKRLRLLGFHVQHGVVDQEEEEASADHYTAYHAGASSSSYQDEGTSSSHFGGATSWPSWPSWD
jgi:hypothetical protein